MNEVQIAIFAALADELKSVKERMQIDTKLRKGHITIFKGEYKSKQVILVQTGVGKKAMEDGVETSLKYYSFPEAINIGYCGGASPDLAPGDLLIAGEIVDEKSEEILKPDQNLYKKGVAVASCEDFKLKSGRLVSCDNVVASPHEKAFVATKFNAVAIDMESFAFLKAISKANISSLVVRSVLDPLDTELPLIGVIDENGSTSLMSSAEKIIANPKMLLKLPRFGYLAAKARGRLFAFINRWCANAP